MKWIDVSEESEEANTMIQVKNGDLTIPMFAAGLAHELGNPLDAIRRYVNLALDRDNPDLMTKEYLLKAKKGIGRTLNVMNELVTYSRQCYRDSVKQAEIHSLIDRSIDALSDDERFTGIAIQKKYCEESIRVEDPGLLIVLHNLYKNAAAAMKGRGTLTIATRCQNGRVGVAIQDTGEGVPEMIRARIFEPFFSTKTRDERTGDCLGIGLALSRDIVERCGGELRCENILEPVPGARFIMTLPGKKPEPVHGNDQSLQV